MGGECKAALLQFAPQCTGVRLAGLQSVGDKDDRRGLLAVAQCIGCLPDGGGKWRLAQEPHGIHGLADLSAGARRRRDDQFNVAAITLAAVAVGQQADFLGFRDAAQHLADRLARDFKFRATVDLAPHGPGPVHHDDGPGRLCQGRCQKHQVCEKQSSGGADHAETPWGACGRIQAVARWPKSVNLSEA